MGFDLQNRRAGGCARSADRFHFAPRPNARTEEVEALIEGVPFEAFIVDKVFDADWLVDNLLELNPGMKVVKPSNSNRKTRRGHDVEMCKLCRRFEIFFGEVMNKGDPTRFDKTDSGHEDRRSLAGTLEILK